MDKFKLNIMEVYIPKGKTMARIVKFFIIILSFTVSNLFSQEKDLKEIYTDVTTAINSALLTKSGAMELTGFVAYNYYDTEYSAGDKKTEQILQAEPSFAYFIVDNISLGINISYQYQKSDNDLSGKSSEIDQTFVGPIAKLYFGDKKYRPFIFTDYLYLAGDDYGGSEIDVGAGLFYHVTGNFGISLFGKYGIIFSDDDNIDSQKRVFFGIGISNFIL